jgi:hypothetical protein
VDGEDEEEEEEEEEGETQFDTQLDTQILDSQSLLIEEDETPQTPQDLEAGKAAIRKWK